MLNSPIETQLDLVVTNNQCGLIFGKRGDTTKMLIKTIPNTYFQVEKGNGTRTFKIRGTGRYKMYLKMFAISRKVE